MHRQLRKRPLSKSLRLVWHNKPAFTVPVPLAVSVHAGDVSAAGLSETDVTIANKVHVVLFLGYRESQVGSRGDRDVARLWFAKSEVRG
jgi:hypothetical protein